MFSVLPFLYSTLIITIITRYQGHLRIRPYTLPYLHKPLLHSIILTIIRNHSHPFASRLSHLYRCYIPWPAPNRGSPALFFVCNLLVYLNEKEEPHKPSSCLIIVRLPCQSAATPMKNMITPKKTVPMASGLHWLWSNPPGWKAES